jgi:predicted GNAT family acetyltransferase
VLELHGTVRDFDNNRRVWKLDAIVVPKAMRGTGVGSQIMQHVIDAADEVGATVALTPSSDFGGSVPRLKRFYKRFGFQPNKGRYSDSSVTGAMIRYPHGARSWGSYLLREANDCHEPAGSPNGGQFCSKGSSGRPITYSSDTPPPALGTTPVPPGMVRAYHYTNNGLDALKSILQHGLSRAFAKGENYGEPNAIWVSTDMPKEFKYAVEVWLKPDEMTYGPHSHFKLPDGTWQRAETPEQIQRTIDDYTGNSPLTVDRVPPARIVTYQEPWTAMYHQLVNDGYAGAIANGDHDDLMSMDPERYGRAFTAIKKFYRADGSRK